MNQIIDIQRPIHDKTGLGYNQRNDELGSSSKTMKYDKKIYMDIVKENLQEAGTSKLEEKGEIQAELEKEIVVLRRKLQKENINRNFNKNTEILNQIIDS